MLCYCDLLLLLSLSHYAVLLKSYTTSKLISYLLPLYMLLPLIGLNSLSWFCLVTWLHFQDSYQGACPLRSFLKTSKKENGVPPLSPMTSYALPPTITFTTLCGIPSPITLSVLPEQDCLSSNLLPLTPSRE